MAKACSSSFFMDLVCFGFALTMLMVYTVPFFSGSKGIFIPYFTFAKAILLSNDALRSSPLNNHAIQRTFYNEQHQTNQKRIAKLRNNSIVLCSSTQCNGIKRIITTLQSPSKSQFKPMHKIPLNKIAHN